jgi:hypothetical protein
MTNLISQERLKQVLWYDQESGIFRWRYSLNNRTKAWKIAGVKLPKGYIHIGIDKKMYRAHRLAWLYVHGEMPLHEIDNLNQITNDNRISNLRLATRKQNSENRNVFLNNKTGCRGVSFHKKSNKYRAQVRHLGKTIHLGLFGTIEDASQAARAKRLELFTHSKEGTLE